jgi:hypothetical protein
MQRKRAISAAAAILLLLPSGWVAWQSRHMAQMGHLGDDGSTGSGAKLERRCSQSAGRLRRAALT